MRRALVAHTLPASFQSRASIRRALVAGQPRASGHQIDNGVDAILIHQTVPSRQQQFRCPAARLLLNDLRRAFSFNRQELKRLFRN